MYIISMAKRHKTPPAAKRPPTDRASEFAFEIWAQRRPTLAAVLLFALLTVIFFGVIRPALFSPGKMIYGTDTMGAGVFFRTFYAEFWRQHHTMPLWEPYIHGGMPFVDAMHGDIFYPAAILQIIFPVTYALGLKLILHVFLAGLFMYLFLRDWGLSWRSAVFGGILYMFAPCLVSLFYPGHDGKIYVTALTPLAFMLLRRGTVERRWSSFFGFGLVYALLVLTAHVQMAYYASWGLALYFLFLLWDAHRFKLRRIAQPVAAFVLVVVLAAGASAIQWLSPYFYLKQYSQRIQHTEGRGFEWASSWSMHAEEAGALLVPEFPGDNLTQSEQTYWGQNFFKLNSEAVGLLAMFFAVLTLAVQRRRQVVFFGALAVLALIYALGAGTPLFTLSYYLVPMVGKFRAPSMINFLFAFGFVAVAAWGVHILERMPPKAPAERSLFTGAVILAIVYTAITLVISLWGEGFFRTFAGIFRTVIEPEKMQALRVNAPRVIAGLWVSTILLWGVVGLVWSRCHRSLKLGLLFGGLAALALIDLWRFDARFVQLVNPQEYYGRTPLVDHLQQVKASEGPFRTFILPRTVADNYLALYGLEEVSMSAMHGNHLLSYDNFTGRHEERQNLSDPKFLDLLNVTRVVSPQEIGQDWLGQPARVGQFYVYTNPNALPRVAGFSGYRVVPDHEAVLAEIKRADFLYRQVLLLEQEIPELAPTKDPARLPQFVAGRVIDNTINEFTIEIEMPADGLVLLSENYYPAWRAEEQGVPLTIYRANYTFRAVFAKAGPHTIHFWFDNPRYDQGKLMSAVCLLVLLAGRVATGRRKRVTPQSGQV